jgi:hypothetical protein
MCIYNFNKYSCSYISPCQKWGEGGERQRVGAENGKRIDKMGKGRKIGRGSEDKREEQKEAKWREWWYIIPSLTKSPPQTLKAWIKMLD